MSGKHATPASAGAPRLLLYVADSRHLDPGGGVPSVASVPTNYYLPDNSHNSTDSAYREQHNSHSSLINKSASDSDTNIYYENTSSQNGLEVHQRPCKESCSKIDTVLFKQDIINHSEYMSVDTFEGVPLEASLNQVYPGYRHLDNGCVSSMLPVSVSQLSDKTSDSKNVIEKEYSSKSYMNYKYLEDSGHSVVNQQVGYHSSAVTIDSEVVPQLLRAPDGSVVAVVPSQQLLEGDQQKSLLANQGITVPLGWKRIVSANSVIYFSPNGTSLSSIPQVREYLQTTGTCKCGLPCPLRPEITFNFDPKMPSKPYQTPTSSELTKLCNHKRKLLATLARAHSPATPPPQIEQKKGEVLIHKKKMKKRVGQPTSVQQMMLQVERPLNDIKAQDFGHCRNPSPGVNRNQHCQQVYQQNTGNTMPFETETPVQKSSHYLTVSSGWITQQENFEQKDSNPMGQPVMGNNGQVIGINTSFNKQSPYKNMSGVTQKTTQEEIKDEKKTLKPAKNEQQIFCGLNQPLTPEVMQKINEQQQLFIQQNQKQIEMAMKGYRMNMSEGTNQSHQAMQQSQLVVQNGAVVKTNPAKTPPWQVKRGEIQSPSKSYKSDSMDFEDSQLNSSEDSVNSSSSFQSNDSVNQNMCSRVPPLPQHYNMINQQWPQVETNKKKSKSKLPKKKANNTENRLHYVNDIRMMADTKSDDMSINNAPSFMEDPSGYLAQQTVLLNNTISRQRLNSSYDQSNFDVSKNSFGQGQNYKLKHGIQNPNRNVVSHPSQSPSNTPDSSILFEKNSDNFCKGYNVTVKTDTFSENQIRRTYLKSNNYGKDKQSISSSKQEDNPVTSSTLFDKSSLGNDICGPIQAGTISTSNETLLPPQASPTPSNSSRNTDTPHSIGSNGSQPQNCMYPISSPAYSNPGSSKDHYNSNPSTPGSVTSQFNSPGPSATQSPTGTQMMHFISNHNVNKNLMEVDNISMVGVKPGKQDVFRNERRCENSMPGYFPPPHLGGGPAHTLAQTCFIQTFVTTMASGFSVTRDTMTSVLAGRANTATTSINSSQANYVRQPPPPSVNMATSYAIPINHPDPFIHSVNLPTSYPLHIAGTTAQNMISKSPMEMMQNVIGSPIKSEPITNQNTSNQIVRRPCSSVTPGQILISSTGQIIVSNSAMPPPPPKTTSSITVQSSTSTNIPISMNQGNSVVNQPAVVVNTVQAPFVIQQPLVAMDGPVLQQSSVIPQILSGSIVTNNSERQVEIKNAQSFVQGMSMLSPEKKKTKKKKCHTSVTNVLQISAPQQNNNIVVHSSPQHNTSPQFSPRGFQLSPNNNISPAPMLQALTIVPGKSGAPAHIVMNGQGSSNNYSSQQIINSSPSQQINLLQPVNLINNGGGVMQNFPSFQQFIVPNLGGMVMTADGTTIIQENASGMPMQLQLQNVNGQNVLTPVHNANVFTANNGGVLLRTQNQQGKIIQSQHSPGAQFLSPNSQVVMNSPNFNGQLSPLLANLSPTNVTFNTNTQARTNVQTQDFIQTNQVGQPVMVPLSPKQVSISSNANSRGNSTVVQQNTTIVQQQTTLVSNSHNASLSNLHGGNSSRLSIDPNILINNTHKASITKSRNPMEFVDNQPVTGAAEDKYNQTLQADKEGENGDYSKFMNELNPLLEMQESLAFGHVRHSVSTQTLVNQQRKSPFVCGASPPDTTTLSPLSADASPAPRLYASHHTHYADTTTTSPEPSDLNSSAMVQCVSSSEQDIAESHEGWPSVNEFPDTETLSMVQNISMMRQTRHTLSVESAESRYNQMPIDNMNQQNIIPYYEKNHGFKRKYDYDTPNYRNEKVMRTCNMQSPKHDYDVGNDKKRHYQLLGTSNDSAVQKIYDRHNPDESSGSPNKDTNDDRTRKFEVGDLIWGPVKGYNSWPGKIIGLSDDGRWHVMWFGGDRAQGRVEDGRLLTLSEGLEAHHAARTKHRKSRKLNTNLENAIQEAMAELDKKSDQCDVIQTEICETEASCSDFVDTPKRKRKCKDKKKNKSDGSRLRSAR